MLQDEWYSETPLVDQAVFCYPIALDQWQWTNQKQSHFACFTDNCKIVEMVQVIRVMLFQSKTALNIPRNFEM